MQNSQTILCCPECYSIDLIKFGKDSKGNQRFKCKCCHINFIEPHKSNRLKDKDKQKIKEYHYSGYSLRQIARLMNVDHKTVYNLVYKTGFR